MLKKYYLSTRSAMSPKNTIKVLSPIIHSDLFVKIIFVFLIIGAFTASVRPQIDAKVSGVEVKTADSLSFRTWVNGTVLQRGEDIIVNYSVMNFGKRSVYLVKNQKAPNVVVNDLWILDILPPVGIFDDHTPFDLEFVRILPNTKYGGKFIIEARIYEDDADYEFNNAAIRVGFSYISDITDLKKCEKERIPECRKILSEKARNLTLGNLVIDIVEK